MRKRVRCRSKSINHEGREGLTKGGLGVISFVDLRAFVVYPFALVTRIESLL